MLVLKVLGVFEVRDANWRTCASLHVINIRCCVTWNACNRSEWLVLLVADGTRLTLWAAFKSTSLATSLVVSDVKHGSCPVLLYQTFQNNGMMLKHRYSDRMHSVLQALAATLASYASTLQT